jgi:hypothetical protein
VSSNSAVSNITALKGEILLLQRRIEEVRGVTANHEMESLEKRLLSIPQEMDEANLQEAKASLMEILLELMKNLSICTLERADPTVVLNLLPTRTSAFLNVIDYVTNLGARRRVWDERVGEKAAVTGPTSIAAAGGGSQQPREAAATAAAAAAAAARFSVSTLDLALNEPTAAEVRKLAAEQRILQSQLKAVLDRQVAPGKSATAAVAATLSSSAAPAETTVVSEPDSPSKLERRGSMKFDASSSKIQLLQKQLEAATLESAQLRKRVADLESKAVLEGCTLPVDEVPEDILKRIRGLSFGCDAKRLIKMDIPIGTRPILSDVESASFASRMAMVFSEVPLSNTSSPEPSVTRAASVAKPAKNAKPEFNHEPALWFALQQQSLIVSELCNRVEAGATRYETVVSEKNTEIDRLQRVVSTLEQRIEAIKLQSTKAALTFEAESTRLAKDISRYKKLLDDFMVQQATNPHRIVNAKGQIATTEEREKTLREEVSSRQQSIGDLTDQLKNCKLRLDQEKESSAAVARERQSLLKLRSTEAAKATRLLAEAAERQEEIEHLKEQMALLKKEIREKTVAETELRERAWKLDVEHHIAQNVITELRQREKTMVDQLSDSMAIRLALQQDLHRLRDELVEGSVQHQ